MNNRSFTAFFFQAEDDAELMKSLVSTLEQELNALKDKLRVADEQLRVFETNQNGLVKGTDALAKLLSGEPAEGVMADLDAKLKDTAGKELTICDLELHVAVLNAQKASLREEADRLRSQLAEMRNMLERERIAHQQLNEQRLESERAREADVKRLNELLSLEQERKLQMSKPDADNPGDDGLRPPSGTSTPSKGYSQFFHFKDFLGTETIDYR